MLINKRKKQPLIRNIQKYIFICDFFRLSFKKYSCYINHKLVPIPSWTEDSTSAQLVK